jgi:hypothetical protein
MAPAEVIAQLVNDINHHPVTASDVTAIRATSALRRNRNLTTAPLTFTAATVRIEQAYARTGSIHATMQATGLPYRHVRDVIQAMAA